MDRLGEAIQVLDDAIRILPAGEAAVLVELPPSAVLPFTAAVQADPHPGVSDLVPAERTLLVRFRPEQVRPAQLVTWLRSIRYASLRPAPGPLVELGVHYDGADLAEVGRLIGRTGPELIAAHTGQDWVVAFSGFAPGFGYLRAATSESPAGDPAGADWLAIPRRPQPRVRVPAGSVALAAGYCGVYPRASPGGWQLIGRTAELLWNPDQDPPARLRPGVRVRFHDLDAGPGPGAEPDRTERIDQGLAQDAAQRAGC